MSRSRPIAGNCHAPEVSWWAFIPFSIGAKTVMFKVIWWHTLIFKVIGALGLGCGKRVQGHLVTHPNIKVIHALGQGCGLWSLQPCSLLTLKTQKIGPRDQTVILTNPPLQKLQKYSWCSLFHKQRIDTVKIIPIFFHHIHVKAYNLYFYNETIYMKWKYENVY